MHTTGEWLASTFTNRELALGSWVIGLLAIALLEPGVRRASARIVAAALQSKLLVLFGGYAAYVALVVRFFERGQLWDAQLLAPTIIWYFFGGVPMLARAFHAEEGSQHFRGYAISAVNATAILGFIYAAKSFSLLAELILTPIIAILAMMIVVAESKAEFKAVGTLMSVLLAAVASLMLWGSVSQIMEAPDTFFTFETLKAFLLPIYLTLGSIPFYYATHCYSHIEGARVQIDQKKFQSDELKAYAKKRFFLTFALRPWLLRRATRQFHVLPANANADVDRIIGDILRYEREEDNPPEVDRREGWSPYKARELLADLGLRTGDYHQGYAEEWWSGVASVDLDDSLLPSSANFSFEGRSGMVTRLKLRGHFLHEFVTDAALERFSAIAAILFTRAVPDAEVPEQLDLRVDFQIAAPNRTKASLVRKAFPNGKGFELIFVIAKQIPSDGNYSVKADSL